ncbi:hypothetical protein PV689_12385 [Streptomyces sp. ATCC51928]|uniref:Translation initiation factor IF-2 n=1 Tax=Streptomyces caviscabies TaxID=90079 RepID=A0ABW2M933_9ACTN|nr:MULTISPECIES: hypothetical protein [unclassified Streptomyces]MDX3502715.1 hypothetical protein [Streptomyces sp. ATCC51928]MDX5524053.1 hypothetical protein [Streptomyces sp. DE06-01C]
MDEGQDQWIRVPVGDDAARWATRVRCRRVLLVVHNVTSATRLLDVLPLFHDDLGIQLLATCTGSSAFRSGIADLLADTGVPVLPWEQALATPVGLAISASFGGELHAIQGPLVILSHGIGYTKRLAAPISDRRLAGVEGGDSLSGPPPVFGLSPDWLLSEGAPLADALVLSHPEQFDRLAAACPEALPTAVLAGDPCFDRMLSARPYRERFRRAFGVRRGQRLVLLNSTWGPQSLLGNGEDDDVVSTLLPQLTSELPADEYRVAAVLHPNIWHGHGPGQIRAWLDRARRSGLTLIDPLKNWRQALVAADLVIGDHGSVTYYAAALGTPVLLGAAPLDGLDPDAPIADFIRTAPRLNARSPLRGQVDALIESHVPQPGPMRFTSSVPGEAAVRLRRTFYELMGAPEPSGPALLEPLPLPAPEPAPRTAPLWVLTRFLAGPEVAVTRYAGPAREPAGSGDDHLAVHEDTRDPGQLDLADVVFRDGSPDDQRFGPPGRWAAEVLDRHPHCALAAYVTGPSSCLVRTRDGALLRLTAGAEADADPAVYASAVHAWLAAGGTHTSLIADGLTVRTGSTAHHVLVAAETTDPVADGTEKRRRPTPAARHHLHANGGDTPRDGRRSPRSRP